MIQDPFSLSTPAQNELRSAMLVINRIEASISKIKEARHYLHQQLQQYPSLSGYMKVKQILF